MVGCVSISAEFSEVLEGCVNQAFNHLSHSLTEAYHSAAQRCRCTNHFTYVWCFILHYFQPANTSTCQSNSYHLWPWPTCTIWPHPLWHNYCKFLVSITLTPSHNIYIHPVACSSWWQINNYRNSLRTFMKLLHIHNIYYFVRSLHYCNKFVLCVHSLSSHPDVRQVPH